MKVADRVVVVTGGGAGIGEALCRRFRREGAAAVVVADRDAAAAERVAAQVGGLAVRVDVTDEAAVAGLVEQVEREAGPIGLFCSNAGVLFTDPDQHNAASGTDEQWQFGWQVHVMAHVYAVRALVPRMRARGGGHLLHTVSAAGLLTQPGGGVYATTKHAAIGFAEHVAITHAGDGIKVSVLCPQAVDTAMIRQARDTAPGPAHAAALDGVLSPEQVADEVIRGLDAERFLILPHPQVLTYLRRKGEDYDRWLDGMSRLRAGLLGAAGPDRD
ncbi:MAG TPA: SDR family oxidoreductase [Kineosporiaceae bacterium]|nr:SDR family oxidoreductase [Kineosporiaceae bacterium]